MAKTKRETAIHNTLDWLIETLAKKGAEKIYVGYRSKESLSLTVREGGLETLSTAAAMKIDMNVWVGDRSGHTSIETNNRDDLGQAAESLVQSARAKPEAPYSLPADIAQLSRVRTNRSLDLYDPTKPDSVHMKGQALAMEAAAMAVPKIVKSRGASASQSHSTVILKTNFGFEAALRSTMSSLNIGVIAQDGEAMQNGGESSVAIYASDLEDPVLIGQRAGQEAASALNPRQATQGQFPVIFHPDIAVSLLGHFANAASGDNIYRGQTFLSRDNLGKPVLAAGINILSDPHLKRGLGSSMITNDLLPSKKFWLVRNGELEAFLLDLEYARRLGLDKTAIIDDGSNLTIEPGHLSPEAMIANVQDGLYVTGLMGQGVNLTNGNYSRGASGFWIKNGEIAYPVDKATIAGNLRDMFLRMSAANDLSRMRSHIAVPTLMVDGMVIA